MIYIALSSGKLLSCSVIFFNWINRKSGHVSWMWDCLNTGAYYCYDLGMCSRVCKDQLVSWLLDLVLYLFVTPTNQGETHNKVTTFQNCFCLCRSIPSRQPYGTYHTSTLALLEIFLWRYHGISRICTGFLNINTLFILKHFTSQICCDWAVLSKSQMGDETKEIIVFL